MAVKGRTDINGSAAPDLAFQNGAQDALNRMSRAHQRRTGCHLTAEMIQSLSLTTIGAMWSEEDPREDRVNEHEGSQL
jgi:hypothetical protein